jgi:ribonuclease HI
LRSVSRALPGDLPEAAPGEILVWTDGACRRNPGPGGWAALVCWEDGITEERSGGLAHTTNNIMEMTAALEGLRWVPDGSRVCVVTDSRYLHDGMTSWMSGWKRRGWTTAAGAPVKNRDLWLSLESAEAAHEVVRWPLGQGPRRSRAQRTRRRARGRRRDARGGVAHARSEHRDGVTNDTVRREGWRPRGRP